MIEQMRKMLDSYKKTYMREMPNSTIAEERWPEVKALLMVGYVEGYVDGFYSTKRR